MTDESSTVNRLIHLLDRFRRYYDVQESNLINPRYIAVFRSSLEKYILTRDINLWTTEDDEYVFFYEGSELTDEEFESDVNRSLELFNDYFVHSENHRSTMVTSIMVYDSVNPVLRKKILNYRYFKSFRFMLKGWMRHRVLVVDLKYKEVICDHHSKGFKDIITSLLSEIEG